MDTILIIEDDADLREGLEYTLSGEGYQILTAENAERGRKLWKTSSCDLILLDCNLPDGNGFSLCSEIRESSDVFILMLTARDTELDEVKALEMGVDDYMSKPFSIAVLKARIKKLLSRKSEKQWISSNGIRLDKSSCQVICKEEVLELSKIEYKLLLYFLENPGQILSKEQILERIWDKDGKFVDENTVSVNIGDFAERSRQIRRIRSGSRRFTDLDISGEKRRNDKGMESIITGILSAGCVAGVLFGMYEYRRRKKLYRETDRMLESILKGDPILVSDLKEGEVSALSGKIRKIQEMQEMSVSQAEEEKEQVKSLISNMSHQLKTPLANIRMYEEILREENQDAETREKFLAKMQTQSEKLEWILNSLFKMVKLEQNVMVFEVSMCPIRKTILDAVNLVYEKAARKQIPIKTGYIPDLLLYHNAKWTSEVFANLLENAVKYTGEGGTIQIDLNQYEMYAEIRITDTGIGIRKEEIPRIFQRFYRSKDVENLEGSGIGLYLSRLIAEKEKGYLQVESVYGKGSCFSVFLRMEK